jgi:hypothetical protein
MNHRAKDGGVWRQIVHEGAVQWLVDQGWRIVRIRYDRSTTPPTPAYTVERELFPGDFPEEMKESGCEMGTEESTSKPKEER